MTLFHLFIVAVVQGITEFLPVSSSGHLILLPNLTGFEDQGQIIDGPRYMLARLARSFSISGGT